MRLTERPVPERRILAAVFDMDGLMLDTEPVYRMAWKRAASDFGHEIDDRLYFRLIGRSNRDAERVLHVIFGEDFPMAEFRARWLEHWKGEVDRRGVSRKPGLDQTLDLLESMGVPKAVATSTEGGDALFTLRRAGLEDRFDGIVTGDQVAEGKPAPDIFLAAAASLGVSPELCIAFEDSDAGTVAARAAGMLTVMVPDMKPPSAEARESASRLLESLEQAPRLIREFCG